MKKNYKTTFNTHKCFIHGNNKCILVLKKGVYPYEYMDDVERKSEISFPEEEDFYSHLNMEEMTDADYVHAKKKKKLKNLK